MEKYHYQKKYYLKFKNLSDDDPIKIEWKRKQKERDKNYFIKNKKFIIKKRKEYAKEWNENNREKTKIRLQKSYIDMKIKNPLKSNYSNYVRRAKNLGSKFHLDFEEFKIFVSNDCFYCGIKNAGGIDRIDNTLGYSKENSLPCCKVCNYMKNKTSMEDFINKCKRIVELHS